MEYTVTIVLKDGQDASQIIFHNVQECKDDLSAQKWAMKACQQLGLKPRAIAVSNGKSSFYIDFLQSDLDALYRAFNLVK